mmetsp:Transcript_59598/g.141812  ORF Transcript_59598/g.141812 Transcript_59598/m.141812 type:complete len:342 (+) Transcript_59598:63-1088(+)
MAQPASLPDVASQADLYTACASHSGLTVLLLWAPWHPPSVQMTKVLSSLANDFPKVKFIKANADVCPGLATTLGAEEVPFVAFLGPKGNKMDAISGAKAPKVVEKVKALQSSALLVAAATGSANAGAAAADGEEEDMPTRLRNLINFSPVMIFMKGSKSEPFCKFSKQLMGIMEKYPVEFSTFDILQDDEVRQGLKDYSNWQTYPQMYVNGEFIGGVDIVKEMDEEGSLEEALNVSQEEPLEARLQKLISKEPVMIFMKGDPDGPRCGFSGKLVALLREQGVEFGYFDILSDEDVRQGLKSYSNWPTYPQVYAKGRLVGGLDIIKELADEGALLEELNCSN